MAISSAPLTRAGAPSIQERGIRSVLFRNYARSTSEWERIYNQITSIKGTETDVIYAGVSQFELKIEGAAPTFDNIQEAYRKVYTHLTFGMGLRVTREMREDDLYGVIMKLAAEQGDAAAYTQEVQAMAPFNNSGATQYTANNVNYPLLSTAHYRQDDGTWSNRLSSGADLTPEALETLLNQWLEQMVDQRGNNIRIDPRVLMVGINDKYNAMRIINSDLRAYSADNDTNVLKSALVVQCYRQLTNDGRWYILAEKEDTTLNWFWKRKLDVERDTDSSGTQNDIYVATWRSSLGISSPTGIAGSL